MDDEALSIPPGYEGRRFAIENGDGEPEWLHPRYLLDRVTAPWFPASLGDWGPAWLVRIIDGPKRGALLGLTPRGTTTRIEDMLDRTGAWVAYPYVGGVVHPNLLQGGQIVATAAGMTTLTELLR